MDRDQTDRELYYEVRPFGRDFAVFHQASGRMVTGPLHCLEATDEAERLTEEAHRRLKAIRNA